MYKKELELLKKRNRIRKRTVYPSNLTDLASNDYLAMAENGSVLEKACFHTKRFGSHGAKASIVVNGYHEAHKLLEEKLKHLNGFEDAIILGSGFLANLALFELGRKNDLFLIDEEYHASGILGSKFTRAKVRFFKHNDLTDLKIKSLDYKKYNRVFVVVEGVYSMKGDIVNKDIINYAYDIGYLIIDEAHSVGVMGENLMGITDELSLKRDKTVKMGTLGKALGSYGAYILAQNKIIEFLLNKAKSVIYTTALSILDTMLAYYALEEIQNRLEYYKEQVNRKKLILNSDSLIKIIKAQNTRILLEKQNELLQKGILIGAIRPPTVKSPIFRIIGRIGAEDETVKQTLEFLRN